MLLSTAIGCARVIEPSAPASTATTSVETATAFPTVVAPTDATASVSPDAGLILHLTTASDLGGYGPGTTILDDRRIIWGDSRSRPIESRLGRGAFADVLAAIETVNALNRNGR